MSKEMHLASVISEPTGETLIDEAALIASGREAFSGFIAMGFADRMQQELEPDERGIAFVEMNKSGKMTLEAREEGVIATSSLAGCTGVVGFAKKRDGSTMQFISHYDAMSQNSALTGENSPVNRDLYTFQHQALTDGDLSGPISLLVTYPESVHAEERLGKKFGSFDNWHYLDQIQTTASQMGQNVRILLMPYHPTPPPSKCRQT